MFIQKVFAQQQEVSPDLIEPLGPNFQNLGDIFGFVLNLIIGVGWALVFIMLALGFVQYITSRGEKDAVESAQKWLTYAVIGGVGLFFITFIKTILPQLLGSSDDPAPWLDF